MDIFHGYVKLGVGKPKVFLQYGFSYDLILWFDAERSAVKKNPHPPTPPPWARRTVYTHILWRVAGAVAPPN